MDATWWTKPEDLDDDQKDIVNNLDINEDHLIIGPPGSGKTNILILRATYLHLLGHHNTCIVTFNRTLREFLASSVGHYDFATDKIQTFVKWGVGVLHDHGEKIELVTDDFDARHEAIGSALSELISSGKTLNKFDYILLDESQDYTASEIESFRQMSNRILAVGDSLQQIYKDKDGLAHLRTFCRQAPPLKYHYRNGRKICRVADALRNKLDTADGLEATSQYDESNNPSTVDVSEADSIDAQADEIVSRLERQMLAFPDERLCVACPRHKELTAIWKFIVNSAVGERAQLQTYKQGYTALNPEKPVCITTLHGTKGMEFRAMHIAGTEHIKKFGAIQRNLIYTGITRAKTSLIIHHAGTLPGYLENALDAVNTVPTTPNLADLFKGGS